ncbi:DUF4129 domain-containing transglutaminase family protein [Alteribacter populi]|uniref:DUF4129 domain-containing transglutaminase family protein n=1 Tax=Alteribacter populi TaxID=2011011 RepID=UPI0018E3E5A2|nr:transglutaminase domain-containing protein [Alteribacter populi]
MKRFDKEKSHTFVHFLVYALGFLLVWEWLKPIPLVTYTGEIEMFAYFAMLAFLLIFFKVPFYATIPLLFIGSLYGLHTIFHEGSFFSREGGGESVRFFFADLAQNFRFILSWDLYALTDPFRSFLFFLLLGLVAYLMYFWIFHIKKIFFFIFATIVYITLLDTFTVVDASMAIVRIVVISFFLVSMLHMLSVQAKEKEIGRRSASFMSTAWLYTLVVMILAATTIGYAAPKLEPQWDDPVPAMERWVTGETGIGGEGVRRVGYGDNDERLGGGFIQDDTPVFYAETEQPGYWRGESKHEYTGHGWVSSPQYEESSSVFQEEVDYYMYDSSVKTENYSTLLTMEEGVGYSNLFYPGQLTSLNVDTMGFSVDGQTDGAPVPQFETDVVGGEVVARGQGGNEDVQLLEYELQYDYPAFNIDTLESSDQEDPDDIRDLYLQLPDDLPERVVELAEEITDEHDNRYDKVVAVEQYFSENDFTYDTADIPVPEEGEDYVDQFLFDSRRGYCDNFSTSMAVLLRSVDIPTRWVKGFTEGESVENLDDGLERYEVTNGNAHSWVEVYFEGVGWVPFEPTQGFNNNVEFTEESEELDITTEDDEEDEDRESAEVPGQDDMTPPMEDDLDEGSAGPGSGGTFNLGSINWLTPKTFFISLIVLVIVLIMYQKKHRMLNRYFLWYYKLLGRDERFVEAYQRALWILDNEGIPRGDGETLREYAKRVDHITGTMAMGRLTDRYERVCYGGKNTKSNWSEEKHSWEELVNALKS